jgi:hypothetical protein
MGGVGPQRHRVGVGNQLLKDVMFLCQPLRIDSIYNCVCMSSARIL